MRKNITINNKKYIFDDQIRDNLAVRTGFDRLAQQTFDISFEEWHKGGWWQENYQPHLLLCDGKVAANLSVNRIDCQINGVRRRMFPTLSHTRPYRWYILLLWGLRTDKSCDTMLNGDKMIPQKRVVE